MKVGDFVRTKYEIKQIYEIDNNKTVWKYKFKLKKQDGDGCTDLGCFSDSDVIKSSPNIIDLIEVGDYVNGYLVTTGNQNVGSIYISEIDELGLKKKLYEEDIKSIVTKESMESVTYYVK